MSVGPASSAADLRRGSGPLLAMVLSIAVGLPAAAAAQAPFTDEAQARGIDYRTNQTLNRGQGVAFADLDDDGDPDVVAVGSEDGTVGIFENDGSGRFVDRFAKSGIGLLFETSSVVLADYDGDGDLDIHVGRYDVANVLLRNDGGFRFTDVTSEAGIGDDGNTYGCAWGDYDGDGRPDLYVANRTIPAERPGRNRLYHNLGNGVFEEVAAALGVDRGDDPTLQPAFVDFDRDGDADLYLATDKGTACDTNGFYNHLFENVGGTFVDITESSGTEACVDAMCIAIGDFDGNGEKDLYCTNTPTGNALMMNQGDAVFVRDEKGAGVESLAIGWGSVFWDYDNDGFLDLYVCNTAEVNRLYRYDGAWPCGDMAAALGVDVGGNSFGVTTADIDDDGDLDLLVQNHGDALRLFINHEGAARRWVKFDVVGEGFSRYALGATVRIQSDGVRRVREVVAGSGYKTQEDLVLHWGLGDAVMLETVEVMWPGGTVRTLTSLRAGETWTAYPFDKLGDGDGDGDRDLDDFFAFVACLTGDRPGTINPGCEMMDYEGDGDVDVTDFDLFLAEYDGKLDDCNENGIPDLREIVDGSGSDVNGNGVLDECEAVLGDINGDLVVDFEDLLILLSEWGRKNSPADLNGDGIVDFQDLLILLANWTM